MSSCRSHYAERICPEKQPSTVVLNLCLSKTLAGKSLDYLGAIVSEKLCFQNDLRSHKKGKADVFKFLRFDVRLRKVTFS